MAFPTPNLIWLRTFEAAGRHLSFTAAADEIGMTQAAASQHIKALEGKLGCDLFVRQHRTLSLTKMGEAYLPLVQRALKDLSLSTTGLFGPGFGDLVTVRVSVSTALLWLAPRLLRFRAQYPDIRVRLVTAHTDQETSGERVDIELRLGSGDWPGLRSEWISTERLVPICPAHLRHEIRTPSDFLRHELVHVIGFDDNWTRYFDDHALSGQIGQFGVSVDTSLAAVELVSAGLGCAIVLDRFADTAIAAGRPITKAGGSIASLQEHYIVSPQSDPSQSPLAKTFETWLRAEMVAPS